MTPINGKQEAPEHEDSDGNVHLGEYQCPICRSIGTNTLMKTRIPHFKDVLLFNYSCETCGYVDNEIQDAAPLQDEGVVITTRVTDVKGLNAQVVLSSYAETRLVEIDFGIEPINQKSTVTTIEGYLMHVTQSLSAHIQSVAEAMIAESGLTIQLSSGETTKAADYVLKLTDIKETVMGYAECEEPFTFIIDDPSGNSYVEATEGMTVEIKKYKRTDEQLEKMGYATHEDFNKELDLTRPLEDDEVGQEGMCFLVECPHCGTEGKNEICQVVVPGFGQCVIMAFTCKVCGAKSNEIKPGGGYKQYGKRWNLKVSAVEDLNRDVILSETASVSILEMDIEVTPGTMGSVFTSIEGLLIKMIEGIEENHPFLIGDSAPEMKGKIKQRVQQLQEYAKMQTMEPFTLIIDDPADHSFIGERPSSPTTPDTLSTNVYTRSLEQDEELGLVGMNTEDY